MKIKFIGATPEEDKIVDIPEGVTEVTIPSPWGGGHEKQNSTWPAALVMVTLLVCFTAVIWLIAR